MNNAEFFKRNLLLEQQRCVELFNSQIFIQHQLFTQSAFIEILVRLNYILQELSKKNERIVWVDHVKTNQKIKDITDLVNNIRNAACHSDSPKNFIANYGTKLVFNVFIGECPNAVKIGENILLGCEYRDDIAFYYGENRIYLNRHIKRLSEELYDKINNLR